MASWRSPLQTRTGEAHGESAGTVKANLRSPLYGLLMTSSNGNLFRVTGPLWGESTGRPVIPSTKASDVELWRFLWSEPEQTVEQTMETPVIWDAIALIMTSL